MPKLPEIYFAVLGALKAQAVVSVLFSAESMVSKIVARCRLSL
jgi:acyl-coenzyme A synthetase/AMP-(fatty) acid ligase